MLKPLVTRTRLSTRLSTPSSTATRVSVGGPESSLEALPPPSDLAEMAIRQPLTCRSLPMAVSPTQAPRNDK